MPFSWRPAYASLPSGHATTAFAALVAIGAIFPQARALMWIYAVLIALSRVIITAHHPSDVIAGAIVGAVGALSWCATGLPPGGSDFAVGSRRFGAGHAGPEPAAHHQSSCPPPALCLEGGMSVEHTNDPGRLGHRSGAERGRKHCAAGGRDRGGAGRAGVRGHLRQRRLDRRHRGRAASACKAQYPWLRQIRHARSCGQSAALRTGLWAARGPIIVTLDGDGQNDPAFLPKLIEALEQGAPRVGLVAGQRVGRKASGFKRFQSRFANAVRGAILRDGTRDTGCGLKAFPRDVGLALPYFDGLHRFLPALVRREGREIGYVDVVDRPRQHGVSNYGFWDRLWIGILDLCGVWWLIRRKKRVPDISEV